MRFTSAQDYKLALHFNKELVNTWMDIQVVLYKLNIEDSKSNIYGEATQKRWYVGVQIPCIIKRDDAVVLDDVDLLDKIQRVEFYFLRSECEARGIYPQIGDIIDFDSIYHEVNNTFETQLWAAQVMYKHSIICETHITRASNLQMEPPQL